MLKTAPGIVHCLAKNFFLPLAVHTLPIISTDGLSFEGKNFFLTGNILQFITICFDSFSKVHVKHWFQWTFFVNKNHSVLLTKLLGTQVRLYGWTFTRLLNPLLRSAPVLTVHCLHFPVVLLNWITQNPLALSLALSRM